MVSDKRLHPCHAVSCGVMRCHARLSLHSGSASLPTASISGSSRQAGKGGKEGTVSLLEPARSTAMSRPSRHSFVAHSAAIVSYPSSPESEEVGGYFRVKQLPLSSPGQQVEIVPDDHDPRHHYLKGLEGCSSSLLAGVQHAFEDLYGLLRKLLDYSLQTGQVRSHDVRSCRVESREITDDVM